MAVSRRAGRQEDAQIPAGDTITQPGADALGDCVEEVFADVTVESPVRRHRAKEVGETLPIEPLRRRVPPHDRRTEQTGRALVRRTPTLVRRPHVVLERRMPPRRIARCEALVQIARLAIHLGAACVGIVSEFETINATGRVGGVGPEGRDAGYPETSLDRPAREEARLRMSEPASSRSMMPVVSPLPS